MSAITRRVSRSQKKATRSRKIQTLEVPLIQRILLVQTRLSLLNRLIQIISSIRKRRCDTN